MNAQRLRRLEKRIMPIAGIGLAVVLILGLAGQAIAQEEIQEKVHKEILIKVKSGIIALPRGGAARIPISAARVRSTELRNLNKEYNAVNIEKLYQIKEETKKKKSSGILGFLRSNGEKKAKGTVDLSKIFTRETKKELQAEHKEVVQTEDTFLIEFEFEPDMVIDMSQLASEYGALEVVIQAEYVTRKRR